MQRYIVRRLLLMIPTLFGVTFIVFLLIRAVPGSVVDLITGDYGAQDPAAIQALKKSLGLQQNVVKQYVEWVGQIAHFDFGRSIMSNRTVISELGHRLPVTLELSVLAIIIALLIAIPIGVISAIRQDSLTDYLGRSFAIGLLAAPSFWVAVILITLASFYFQWGVPPSQYSPITVNFIANVKSMLMPAFLLGAALAGGLMRFTRSSMLEVQRQDYIRTAWSKGLRERVIVVRHAMRNALIPVVTVVGLQLPILIGGTVIIESIYNIPGMGRYYVTAVNQHDYPVIQAINVIIALAVVFANLAVDLLYGVIDPRIRYS